MDVSKPALERYNWCDKKKFKIVFRIKKMFIFVLKYTKHTSVVHLLGHNESEMHFCAHFLPPRVNPILPVFVIKKRIL